MLLTWAFDEQNTISYFCLKYFPVLFPNVVDMTNTTDARYEAVGLIPQATYVFELQPILEEESASQTMSIDVILDKPIRKFYYVIMIIIMLYFLFTAPVENVSAIISSGTSVNVSWNMDYELPGWSSLHFLVYYGAHSPDGLHSVHQVFEVSKTSYTNIKIDHLVLEADWQHQFQVSAVLPVGIDGLEVIESIKTGTTLRIDLGMSLRALQ